MTPLAFAAALACANASDNSGSRPVAVCEFLVDGDACWGGEDAERDEVDPLPDVEGFADDGVDASRVEGPAAGPLSR